MSEELRPCPFCGGEPVVEGNLVACNNLNCPTYDNYWTDPMIFTCDQWNTRPIEDALNTRIAKLEAYIDQLIEIGGWAITGMTIATSYSPGVMQNIAERKSDDWYALINNLKECDKEKEREE